MCGISCIVVLDDKRRCADQKYKDNTSARLDQSFEQLQHRGPDSSGKWISDDGRVALGHVRLEINDLTPTGYQPLHSTDGTVHVVVNGEIYDYPRLRAEMEEKINYKFQGTSDCELVLALYKYYGLSFMRETRGEFSICLYDSNRELFIAVKDRYGIKPLFWTIQNGELFIAAEMKAFLPLGWQPEWDVKSIVGGDFQINNCTAFKSVQKVRPGHMLICRQFGTISEVPYWQSQYPDKNVKEHRTEEEMIQGVRDRLLDSIKQRLRADVKVGVSLSGGIDSSVVAGMVNHLLREGHQIGSEARNERLSCFGIAFDEDSGFDESVIAERTAKFLNVKFYKKLMNEQELANHFEEATWICEQAHYDLNFVGVYALSELFREKGYKVNINGQGSDEIFGGYDIFVSDFLREPDLTFEIDHLSGKERAQEVAKVESRAPPIIGTYARPSPTSTARRQLNNIITPHLMAAIIPVPPVKSSFLPLVPPDIEQTYAESLPGTVLSKIQLNWHPLHSAEYTFITGHLQNLILSHLGDRGEMAHSIEGRTPFLDHHLTEYVNGLPPSMKIRRDPKTGVWLEKYILREASRPFITDELYTRRKHPYSAPFTFPVGGPIYKLFKELVTVENVDQLGWIDTAPGACNGVGIDELVDEAFNKGDFVKWRIACCLAQWVVLQRRFGVTKSMPVGAETNGESNGVEGVA